MRSCINVLSRTFSISSLYEDNNNNSICMYQCPVSDFLHFFKDSKNNDRVLLNNVSMSCLGLSPFLRSSDDAKMAFFTCINVLSRTFSISSAPAVQGREGHLSVSMSCLGLSPFLRGGRMTYVVANTEGINVLSRTFSISSGIDVSALVAHHCNVSMSCLGLSPFLQDQNKKNEVTAKCINVLSRTFSISSRLKRRGAGSP